MLVEVLEITPFSMLSGITETVPLTVFAAYALDPFGRIATPFGSVCTGTSASLRLRSCRTSKKLTVLLSGFATARKALSAVSAKGCDDVGPEKILVCCADTLL